MRLTRRPTYTPYETGPYGPYANPLLSRAPDWTSLSILNTRPQSSGVWPVSVARAGQRGQEDNSRTKEGQQQDKRRTRPGHRARPQSSGARPVSVASSFYLRYNP